MILLKQAFVFKPILQSAFKDSMAKRIAAAPPFIMQRMWSCTSPLSYRSGTPRGSTGPEPPTGAGKPLATPPC